MPNLRRRPREPVRVINARIPASLHAQVVALGLNPRTGRVRHGFWTHAVVWALHRWLDEQKVRQP